MKLKKRIININKRLGGKLKRSGSLDFACDRIRNEKNPYKRNAYLIRAIVVDHPFSDFSKSTAIDITLKEFKKKGIRCKEESYLKGILNIAKTGESDIDKIERKLRKWCKKK